jgi:hypothetical protein
MIFVEAKPSFFFDVICTITDHSWSTANMMLERKVHKTNPLKRLYM